MDDNKVEEKTSDAIQEFEAVMESFRKDSDFARLPLPDLIRKKYDIPLEYNEIPLTTAVQQCFASGLSG